MNTRHLVLGALLLATASSTAFAQATGPTGIQFSTAAVTASMVGRWIHDARGTIIGSVRGLSDDGQTAEIMVGSYFQPGSHVAEVPLSSLSIANGNVTLRPGTLERRNTASQK